MLVLAVGVETTPTHEVKPNQREDQILSEQLQRDPKERAEHIMLVDLGRNDLGRVSRPGTVRSGFTFTLPVLSVSAPSHFPAEEATTPAVHSTVRLPMRCPFARTPSASRFSTLVFVRTSTPMRCRCSCARLERSSG